MKIDEKQIEESILTWLNLQYDCMAFKLNLKGTWNPRRGHFCKAPKWVPRGGADIIFCLGGRFGCFEVKTPESYEKFWTHPGKHELEQQAFLRKIRTKGGLAEVVCSLKQVEEYVFKLRMPSPDPKLRLLIEPH